ncbi:MAG: hypothetical protein KA232_02080 [Chryseobacterium sp.]|nr:hypothetical protein [Chryseobacterium sp.]
MTNPIALIAVEIPQQALDKVGREELQRKAGSRLQRFNVLLVQNSRFEKTSDI